VATPIPRDVVRTLADLVLAQVCAGCREPGAGLCPTCRAGLAGAARAARPEPAPAGLPPCFAVADYDGSVRAVLLAYKERSCLSLAGPLGAALARSALAAGHPGGTVRPLVLVPVPSAPAAVRRRGHDAVGRVSLVAAGRLRRQGVPAARWPVLRQTRAVTDQAGLHAGARALNMAGALAVPPRLRAAVAGRAVVIVDDVVTTGATLAAAAAALDAAGAVVLGGAVVAATRRRVPAAATRDDLRNPAACD
jgi:predicted amidophosphoribosyltransferase